MEGNSSRTSTRVGLLYHFHSSYSCKPLDVKPRRRGTKVQVGIYVMSSVSELFVQLPHLPTQANGQRNRKKSRVTLSLRSVSISVSWERGSRKQSYSSFTAWLCRRWHLVVMNLEQYHPTGNFLPVRDTLRVTYSFLPRVGSFLSIMHSDTHLMRRSFIFNVTHQ